MRTIDADTLLEKVEKIQPWDAYLGKYAQGIRHCMELVSLLIRDAPTIEPEQNNDATWDALSKVYNMQGVPDEAKSIIGDMMLSLGEPERETGEWLPDNTNYIEERYICSKCKRSHRVDTCMGKPMWDFCPSCGKRMSGGGQS